MARAGVMYGVSRVRHGTEVEYTVNKEEKRSLRIPQSTVAQLPYLPASKRGFPAQRVRGREKIVAAWCTEVRGPWRKGEESQQPSAPRLIEVQDERNRYMGRAASVSDGWRVRLKSVAGVPYLQQDPEPILILACDRLERVLCGKRRGKNGQCNGVVTQTCASSPASCSSPLDSELACLSAARLTLAPPADVRAGLYLPPLYPCGLRELRAGASRGLRIAHLKRNQRGCIRAYPSRACASRSYTPAGSTCCTETRVYACRLLTRLYAAYGRLYLRLARLRFAAAPPAPVHAALYSRAPLAQDLRKSAHRVAKRPAAPALPAAVRLYLFLFSPVAPVPRALRLGLLNAPPPRRLCISGGCTCAASAIRATVLARLHFAAVPPALVHAAVPRATPLAPACPSTAAVRSAPTRRLRCAAILIRGPSPPALLRAPAGARLHPGGARQRSRASEPWTRFIFLPYISTFVAQIYVWPVMNQDDAHKLRIPPLLHLHLFVCDSAQAEQLIPLAIAFISNVAFGTLLLLDVYALSDRLMTGSINQVLQGLAIDLGWTHEHTPKLGTLTLITVHIAPLAHDGSSSDQASSPQGSRFVRVMTDWSKQALSSEQTVATAYQAMRSLDEHFLRPWPPRAPVGEDARHLRRNALSLTC
ncbi:hypothetical protein FB451DRAFT_1180522 [Mycena latifolia]|nr:hypothetical protein FB451DRAFT_1180522 [Mycena latifolia]